MRYLAAPPPQRAFSGADVVALECAAAMLAHLGPALLGLYRQEDEPWGSGGGELAEAFLQASELALQLAHTSIAGVLGGGRGICVRELGTASIAIDRRMERVIECGREAGGVAML